MIGGDTRLVIDTATDLGVAAVYAYIGARLARRPAASGFGHASLAFAAWWFGLAATGLVAAAMNVAAARDDLVAFGALQYVIAGTFTFALWGLVSHLAVLLTGRRGALAAVGVVYASYWMIQLYQTAAYPLTGLDMAWRPVALHAREPPALLQAMAILFLLVPQLLAATAHLALSGRVRDAATRYRMRLVGASIMLWTAGVLAVSRPDLVAGDAWQLLARATILTSAGAILAAYEPPPALRRRLAAQSTPPGPTATGGART